MITVGTIGYRKIVSASLMTKTGSLPKISRKKWTTSASAQHLKQQRSRRKRRLQVLISAPPAVAKSETRQFPPQDGDRREGEILRLKRLVISHLLPYLATDHHRGTHLGRHHQAFQDFQRSLNETTQDPTARLLIFLGNRLGLRPSASVSLLRARMARMVELPMSIRLRQPEAPPSLPPSPLTLPLHHHQEIISRHLPSRFSFLFLLFVALRFGALLLPPPLSVVVLPLLLHNLLMHLLLPPLSPLFQRTYKTPYQA